MDPVHPIGPDVQSMPPVAPVPTVRRVQREEGGGKRERRRRQTGKSASAPELDGADTGAGRAADGDGAAHVDIIV